MFFEKSYFNKIQGLFKITVKAFLKKHTGLALLIEIKVIVGTNFTISL